MTSRAKKTYGNKDKKLSAIKEVNENEKENIYSRLRTRKKVTCQDALNLDDPKENLDDQFDKLVASPIKEEIDMKPLGFWSKKLQDLDKQKNTPKKKHGLYEFSGTDESITPFTKKKKLKHKPGVKKKQQQQPKFNLNFNKLSKKSNESKVKKSHEKSLLQERILLHREKKKLADKDEKFTFSTTMSSLGVTSTPAPNKFNLVGASNFEFLSPVIKEEESESVDEKNSQQVPLKLNHENHEKSHNEPVCTKEKTPKRETNLSAVNCRRVLRTRRKKT